MITKIEANSPAARAGLAVGDVVVRVNGRDVASGSDLRNQLGLLRVGSKVDLAVIRDGRTLDLAARLADPYDNFVKGRSVARPFEGAMLGNTVDESPLGHLEAVAVGRVEPDSAAWAMGLREGDVILEVNKQRLRNVEQLTRLAKSDGIQTLRLRRGDQLLLVMARR